MQDQRITELDRRSGELSSKMYRVLEQNETYVADMQNVRHLLSDGHKDLMRAIKDASDESCKKFEDRLKPIEDFNWFRSGITALRDNLFWLIVVAALVVGLVVGGWKWLVTEFRR